MTCQWITRKDYHERLALSNARYNAFADPLWISLYPSGLRFLQCWSADSDWLILVLCEGGVPNLRSIITPPFAPYVGEVTMGNRCVVDGDELVRFLRKEGYRLLHLDFSPSSDFLVHSSPGKQTFRLSLPDSATELPACFHSKTRNMLSKALREQSSVRVLPITWEVAERILDHYHRKHIRSGQDQLKVLPALSWPLERCFAVEVMQGDRVDWSGLFYIHESTCYYLAGALSASNTSNATGTRGIAAAMEECIRRGIRTFDFEGSSIPAIARYFAGFGAIPEQCPAIRSEDWLWKMQRTVRGVFRK